MLEMIKRFGELLQEAGTITSGILVIVGGVIGLLAFSQLFPGEPPICLQQVSNADGTTTCIQYAAGSLKHAFEHWSGWLGLVAGGFVGLLVAVRLGRTAE